jgi:hypothetical protein
MLGLKDSPRNKNKIGRTAWPEGSAIMAAY